MSENRRSKVKKYIICTLFFITISIAVFMTGCTLNALGGGSSTEDLEPPVVSITSHSNNEVVYSTITVSGKITDDKAGLGGLKVYHMDVDDEDATSADDIVLEETFISDITVSSTNTWSYDIDTTGYDDGNSVFKFIATDRDSNEGYSSIALKIDNSGPEVKIIQPTKSVPDGADAYYNTFQVTVVWVDVSDVEMLEWELYSINDATASITGEIESLEDNSYTFTLDPSDLYLSGDDFKSGYCKLKFRGKDSLGNYSSEWTESSKLYFDFENDAPTITMAAPTSTTAASATVCGDDYTIRGFASDDDGIASVTVQYGLVDEDLTDDFIDFSADPSLNTEYSCSLTDLAEGVYRARAKAADIYGTETSYTDFAYFEVNTQYPTIEILSPDDGEWLKGAFNITATIESTSNITNVKISLDNETWSEVYDNSTGVSTYNFSESFDSTTVDGGSCWYYIKATNSSSHSTESSIIFNVDNIAPTGTIESPESGNIGLNQEITISGTAEDEINSDELGVVSSVVVTVNGVDYTSDTIANWSIDYDTTLVADGAWVATVTLEDLAGNTKTYTRTLNIDQDADIPEITVSTPEADERIYGTYTISGTAEDDDSVQTIYLSIDGDSEVEATGTTSWSYNFDSSSYSTGDHTLYYRVEDINGLSSATGSISFEIDPDLPIIEFYNDDNSAVNSTTTVSGRAYKTTGSAVIDELYIKIQGTSRSDDTTYIMDWTDLDFDVSSDPQEVSFSYSLSTVTWADGPVVVYIRAKDDSDRLNESDINLVIDTVNPTGSITSPSDDDVVTDSSLTIKGFCNDSSPSSGLDSSNIYIEADYLTDSGTVNVVDGASNEISGAVSNWNFDWDLSGVDDGLYDINLIVTDEAENSLSSEVTVSNVRIMQYTPVFSDIEINDEPVSDNMFLTEECTFTGTLTDNDSNDNVNGLDYVEIYMSDDDELDSSDGSAIASYTLTYGASEDDFTMSYTFTEAKDYIVYRAYDKVGGYTDYPVLVNIDFEPPEEDFTYSSPYSDTTLSDVPDYSSLLDITFGATDDNDLGGATIQIMVGTSSGGDEILGLTTYSVGDTVSLDLHDITGTIYLWYSLQDRVGNETESVISIDEDSNQPTITNSYLSGGYISSDLLDTTFTVTSGGSTVENVKVSDVDGDITETANDAVDGGSSTWTYSIPDPGSSDDYTITAIVTCEDTTNRYETFEFIYDNEDPVTTFEVAATDEGRLISDNISGTVEFSGIYSDNFGDRYNADDFTITVTIDGVDYVVPDDNKTKNSDGTFDWYYDWNSELLSSVVGTGIEITATVTDAADNSYTYTSMADKDVVPYITYIEEVAGTVVSGYNYDTETSSWANTNDNELYSYRLDSGDITFYGYNLNASGNEVITYTNNSSGSSTWTAGTDFDADMNEIVFDPTWNSSSMRSGEFYITVGSIDSNVKKLYVIKNYAADNYNSLSDTDNIMDMVVYNKLANVVFQKHESGSGVYRFSEDSEGSFDPDSINTYGTSSNDDLMHHYNRWWFFDLALDTASTHEKFYLFSSNTENGLGAATGLQLSRSDDFWDGNIGQVKSFGSECFVPSNQSPYNSYDDCYNNRDGWRPGRLSTYIGDITGKHYDWTNPRGDSVAYSDDVFMVWYNSMTEEMQYRKMVNDGDRIPVYTPTDAPLDFDGFKGDYPAITLNSSGYPVIVAYDADAGDLVIKIASGTDPDDDSDFTSYTVDSDGTTGLYPDVAVDDNGYYHVVYQDLETGSLKYTFSTTIAGLASSTKIVLDQDSAPGYYNHLQISPEGIPIVTYIAYGNIDTPNAIRVARYIGTGTSASDFNDPENWERFTLPGERNITENKVRGYYVDDSTDWIYGFGKSDRPEFFRELP